MDANASQETSLTSDEKLTVKDTEEYTDRSKNAFHLLRLLSF